MASANEPVYQPDPVLEPIRDAIQEILSSAAHSESADDAYSALVRALTNGRKHRPKVVSAAWAAETDTLAIRFRDAQVNRDQHGLQHAKVELRRLQEQLRHINLYGEPDDTSADPMLKRLGELKLEEMLTEKTGIVEVLHPDQIELEKWLSKDSLKGKFEKWWPSKITAAKDWRIEVSPMWDALASLLDRLFPGTCNTHNIFEPRPHVTEAQLCPYLKSVHGLSADEADKLTLAGLGQLLQGDVQ